MGLPGGDVEEERLAPSTLLVGSALEAGWSSGCPQPSRAASDSGSIYHAWMPFLAILWRYLPSSSALGVTCTACWHGPSVGSPLGMARSYFAQDDVLRTERPCQLHPDVELLLPGWCLGEKEEPRGGWENVSGMLHPSYMHRNRGSPMCLSLRALLMPPQSPPHAEVSARLAGGQGGHGEEDGAARREESGKAGSCLVCTTAPGAGEDGLLAGLVAGPCGGPTPHWGG